MSKAILLNRRSAQEISVPNDEYKKKRDDLREKARELRSAAESLAYDISQLQIERTRWQERITLVKRDLCNRSLSENARAALTRLREQAENAYEISGEELAQRQQLQAKIKTQQKGLTGVISRLDNIQYELEMDSSLNARRKELGMDKSGKYNNDLTGFLREIKQIEYTTDALIKLRNDNGRN